MDNEIKLFENTSVRTVWDDEQEKWYISIVDVIAVLTESPNPRKYWSVLKTRLKKEGSQLATNCSQLKMEASDGKYYKTDVADTEQVFRLIQSIPSPKAEPFKLLLAQIANERIDEMQDLKRKFIGFAKSFGRNFRELPNRGRNSNSRGFAKLLRV